MRQIELTVGMQPAESGGILVADENGVIRQFIYDSGAKTNRVEYTPCIDGLAGVISGLQKHRNLSVCGVVHSHPKNYTALSHADVDMANRFFEINPSLQKLYLPIVQAEPDAGAFNMVAYVFHRPVEGGYAMPEYSEIKEIEDVI